MKFILGTLFGALVASLWFLSAFVSAAPFFIVPAGILSLLFLILLVHFVVCDWNKLD